MTPDDAHLLRPVVPAYREMVGAISFRRNEGLKDLANDRTGRVVWIDQVDIVA